MPIELPGMPGAPSGAEGSPPPGGPSAAPMSNPTEQEGLKAQARQGIQLAVKLLESTLIPFGTQSPEGKKILSAITSLTKLGGETGGPDMQNAEMKMLQAQVGPKDAGPPPGPPGGGMPPGMAGGMPMGGPKPMGM